MLVINESRPRAVEGHNQYLLYKLLTNGLWWVSLGNEYFVYQKYIYVNMTTSVQNAPTELA
jgi:hypothetical protein